MSKRNLSEGRDCDQALEIGQFPPSVVGVSPGSAISLYMAFRLRDPETQIRKAITILLLIGVDHFWYLLFRAYHCFHRAAENV